MDSKNTPLVSVVMPSYNGSKFIHTALFSALEQKYTNMECIVIDDGSTDNTKEIVASIQKQDQRVKLVQNTTNQWIAKTLNKWLSVAQGKYIAILDQDDRWIDEYKTHKQVAFLEAYPKISFVWTNGIIKNNKEGYYYSNLPQTDEQLKNSILWQCPFMHSSIMYKKEIYDTIWGYPEDIIYNSDHAYWLKAGENFKFANLPDYTLLYDTNAQNVCYAHYTAQTKEGLLLLLKYRGKYPNFVRWIKNIVFTTLSTYLSKHYPNTRKYIRKICFKPEALSLDSQTDIFQTHQSPTP